MIEKVLNLIIILIALCSILLISNFFAEEIIYPKQAFTTMLVFASIIMIGMAQKKTYRIDTLYLLVLVFILYLLIHSICFSSTCEYMFLCYLIAFFSLYSVFYFNKTKIKANYFYDTLCLAGVIQSVIAFIQLSKNNLISGTSDNQTGLAITLLSIFPFIYFHSRTIQVNWKKTIYVISLGLIVLTVILSGCRTCIVALAVIAGFIIIPKKRIVLFIGISLTLLLTTCYKKDSSKGRAFIYQTSIHMLNPQTIFFGKGHSGFKKEYMAFQAKEFECDKNNSNAILADNVFHPLNEYILLLIEYGIVGCLLAFIIGLHFFKHTDRSSPYFIFILALGVIACFSYPFRYPLTFVLLAYSLASVDCKEMCNIKVTKGFKVIIMFCAIFGVLYMLFDIRNNYLWKKQMTLCSLGKIRKTLPMYDKLYTNMTDNPYFLYNYSMVLFRVGDYQKSDSILLCCNRFLNDYDTELLHADISRALKQYNKAENHYIHASRMCPNRFKPLYQLMCLYKETDNIEQARLIAEMIIKKEIKIPSEQVDKIIQEANTFF